VESLHANDSFPADFLDNNLAAQASTSKSFCSSRCLRLTATGWNAALCSHLGRVFRRGQEVWLALDAQTSRHVRNSRTRTCNSAAPHSARFVLQR
jgi:hypothetical protein